MFADDTSAFSQNKNFHSLYANAEEDWSVDDCL